jgi:hypothetical protein
MHCHADEQVALDRSLDGTEFFEFAKEHYYRPKRHYPGRTNLYRSFGAQYRRTPGAARRETGRPLVARGAIGTPRQLIDVIDRYERVGVDQLIFLTQAGLTRHEDICSSLELFAAQVLCRYREGRGEQEKLKAERLQSAIEAAMSRRAPARAVRADYYIDAAAPHDPA